VGIATTTGTTSVQPLILTPNPTPLPKDVANAIAVGPTGTKAYLGVGDTSNSTSTIHEIDLTTGASTLIATLQLGVTALDFDAQGQLIAAAANFSTAIGSAIYVLTPGTPWTVTQLAAPPGPVPNGLAVETATGAFVVAIAPGNRTAGPNEVWWMMPRGAPSRLSVGPSGGWGVLTGIDIDSDPEPFGAPSPAGVADYRWSLAPNPGGLPTLGNASFALRVVNNGGTNDPGVLLLSPQRGWLTSPIFPGVQILLDPTALVVGPAVPTSGSVPMPIPPAAGLVGAKLFLQTLHVDPQRQLAASEGLALTIL
jgi:hypothetical protein